MFMNQKFFALTIASIMSLNVLPVNAFRKTVQAEINFKSNVGKIEEPVAGGENDEWKGNYVYFGSYPQSSDGSGGYNIEPIKWRVLAPSNAAWDNSKTIEENGFAYNIGRASIDTDTTKGGRQNAPVGGDGILLYSYAALDAKQYHPTYNTGEEKNELCWGGDGGGSGKGCTLWAWLNGCKNNEVSVWGNASVPENPFIEKAFSGEELEAIMKTKVYSEDLYMNRTGATDCASSPRTSLTEDKIFVPSYNEMLNESYGFASTYSNSNTRSFGFSDYSDNLKSLPYSWHRSPGSNLNYANAAYLYSDGSVYDYNSVASLSALPPL